jgi:hypothetical protein
VWNVQYAENKDWLEERMLQWSVLGVRKKMDFYFLLYTFLNFLKSSTTELVFVIWVTKSKDRNKKKQSKTCLSLEKRNSWENDSHFEFED